MRAITTTTAALCLLVAAADSAHATRPAACDDATVASQMESAGDAFGDNDFGGSYSASAGLDVPADEIFAQCQVWDILQVMIDAASDSGLLDQETVLAVIQASAGAQIEIMDALGTDSPRIGAEAGADVTLFGDTEDVFAIGGYVDADGGRGYVEVMGETLIAPQFEGFGLHIYPSTFFSAKAGVDLLIFELTARAKLEGFVGVVGQVVQDGAGFTGSVTPMTGLDVNASAGVDILFASAGVRGSLNLFTASLPVIGAIDDVEWSVTVDAVVEVLDGYIEVYGKLFGESDSERLCSWEGETLFEDTLYEDGGTL